MRLRISSNRFQDSSLIQSGNRNAGAVATGACFSFFSSLLFLSVLFLSSVLPERFGNVSSALRLCFCFSRHSLTLFVVLLTSFCRLSQFGRCQCSSMNPCSMNNCFVSASSSVLIRR